MRSSLALCALVTALAAGCDPPTTTPEGDAAVLTDAPADGGTGDSASPDGAAPDAPFIDASMPACVGTPAECAAIWEQNTSDVLDAIATDTTALAAFLRAIPKGGDLHNHLTGAVYAETYLEWAREDMDCINTTTHVVVYPSMCSASTRPVPTSGSFYDEVVRAWSMEEFVPGVESGHDHFFATFAKFGAVAGAHRDDDLADIAIRAADENQLYIETMFNLGKDVGELAASLWSGTLTAADLPALYDTLMADPTFAAELASDVATVRSAASGYRTTLECAGASPPPACGIEIRFIAQVSRTGASDTIFGQLVSAFEMARVAPEIVGANLSSPEDDTRALNGYDLHMAMLDFLHARYTATGASPLHVTLHAGELTPEYLPVGSTANTFHIRAAVEIAHAERIGHGIDILSETGSSELMDQMRERNILVEVCLSSNDQILEIRGDAHPLAEYQAHGVPFALATDDQGVSRSSLAGEYARGVRDQQLDYRQLKTMARQSLEHAFLPGESLWASIADAELTTACAPFADPPTAACQDFLAASERAQLQWELERRFLAFESAQPTAP
jgi:adenosine deaminase